MKIKPEGQPFTRSHDDWKPRHPARWCLVKYAWLMLRHGFWLGAPAGEMWSCDGHNWTCYMRFRLYSMGWRFGLRHPLSLWEHMHRDYRDIHAMVDLVNGAEDPFIRAHYEVNVRTIEGHVSRVNA
jgi:hypothetical protein